MLQVIAYNKIDVPDSGDYIEEVQEFLWGQGLAKDDVHAISAVTGQGVLGLVRRARAVLDQLPSEVRNPGIFSLPLSLTLSHSLLLAACSVLFFSAVRDLRAQGDTTPHGLLGNKLAVHISLELCAPDLSVVVQAPTQTTDALNMTELPRRISAAEIDDFAITSDLAHGRAWHVEGEAIERFAAMTNWDYYEATLRFQKVLESAGEHSFPPLVTRETGESSIPNLCKS